MEVGLEAGEELAEAGDRVLRRLHEVGQQLAVEAVDVGEVAEEDVAVVEHDGGYLRGVVGVGEFREVAVDDEFELVDVGSLRFDEFIEDVPRKGGGCEMRWGFW